MSSKHILLIDDTVEFSNGLERLLNSMGHFSRSCSNLEQAKGMVLDQDYDFIFIDCFMPMADGFTVSKELSEVIKRKEAKTQIIMMSGIIIDEKTQKEALSKDYISNFLVKPISKDKLEDCVGTSKPTTPITSFFQELTQIQNTQDLEALLSVQKNINGIELSLLITLISKFELSCSLDISDKETQASFSICVHSGSLERITSSEYNNSLGELLVGMKYLSREDLSSYVNSPQFKTSQSPIGQALINLNLLSPHALPIALKQQSRNRLSDLFKIVTFDFKYKPLTSKVSDGFCSLNLYDLRVESSDFLKSEQVDIFLPEVKSCIESLSFTKSQTVKNTSSTAIPDLTSKDYSNDDLKIILSSIVTEIINVEHIKFSDQNSITMAKQHLLDLISNIQFRLKSKNPYEILGVDPLEASDQKISKAYQEIAKMLHPDKVSKILDEKNLEITDSVFTYVSEAFNLIKTTDNRKTYESTQKNKSTKTKLYCNNVLEAAKLLLGKGEYSKAFNNLNKKEMYENPPNDFNLYLLWAALKTENTKSLKKTVSSIFEEEGRDLSNEPLYYYLKGIHSLQSDDIEGFKKYTEQSLAADPKFLPARRELQFVKNKIAQKKNAAKKSSWFSFKKSS